MSNTHAVQSLYAAFGRQDIPGILAHLASNVEWDNSRVASAECPWNGNFSGIHNVPRFFMAVAENFDFSVFEPREFTESGSTVAVQLRLESTLKRTGKPLRNDAVHLWSFNEAGLVTRYRHFNDTAAELEAWRA